VTKALSSPDLDALIALKRQNQRLEKQVAELQQALQKQTQKHEETEEKLRRSQAILEALGHSFPTLIYVKDHEGRVVMANAAQLQQLGKSESEVIGKKTDELLPAHIALPLMENDRKVMDEGISQVFEEMSEAATGKRIYLSVKSPYHDTQGGITGLIGVSVDVTERKRAEESLRESEQRYRALFESTTDAIVVTDPAGGGKVLSVNAAACSMFGYTKEEFLQVDREAMIDASDGRLAITLDEREKAGRAQSELIYKRKDGTRFTGELTTAFFVDKSGNNRAVGIIRDITERKRMEEELRESEKRASARLVEIETYYATSPIGLCVFDTELRYLRINERLAEINGIPPADHIGRTAREVVPSLAEFAEGIARQIIESGEAVRDIEFSGETAAQSGVPRLRREDWYPIKDSNGTVVAINVAVQDITERKRMEEELRKSHDELELRVEERTRDLRQSEEHYGTLFNAIDEGFCIIEMIFDESQRPIDYRFLEINAPFERQTGLVNARGKTMRELAPRHEEHWFEIYGRVALTGDAIRFQNPAKELGRFYDVYAFRYGEPEKRQVGILFNDISERMKAAEEKAKLEEQLRQSHKMEAIGTLAGGIAHDFNNMLAAIIGFTELSMDDVADNPDTQHKLGQVLKAGLRGRDLVKQILAFSRKVEGSSRKEISLASLVEETHALLRSSLPSTIHMRLGLKTEDDCVFADPTQIQQVLMNLATNAADAMQQEGHLTTTLSSVTFTQDSVLPDPEMMPRTYLKLSVKDTGCGMTEEVRHRVFEPFFTTKPQGKGTGMGLAVAYGIVKNHAGTITVQSQPGKGSTFEVYLPQAESSQPKEKETASIRLRHGTERILFVDDEELVVEMGKEMLESLGYKVTFAVRPTDALSLFSKDPKGFDLVITDQTMPDMTGLTLAQKMLKKRKVLPIILCTGHSEAVSAEKAQEVGIRAFLMKPVMKKEMAETVRRVLDHRKADV